MKKSFSSTMIPLALLCTFFWGLSYPLVKVGSASFASDGSIPKLLVFAGVRFLLSGIILAIWNLFRHKKDNAVEAFPTRKNILYIVVLSATLTIIHYTLMYIGLANCSGSKSSILKQIGILVVIFISGIFFPEDKLTYKKVVGCILGFSGIIICNIPFDLNFVLLGEGCVILASLSSSAGDMLSKKAVKKADAIFLSAWQQLVGGLILTVSGLILGGRLDKPNLSGVLAFGGLVLTSIISYTMWMWLAKRYDVSRLALLKLTIPLFGIITSAVLLGEKLFKWQNWAALILITVGVAFAEQKYSEKVMKNDTSG